jgi:hypothetical protein
MNMDQVGNLLDRPRLYYNIDGLSELGIGVMCVGGALLLWLPAHSPARSVWHRISFFVVIGLAWAIHYGTKAIKTHITYPRTGFVEYRRGDRLRTWIIAAVLGALIPLGLGVAVRRHWDITTPASLIGLVFAASYAYGIARAVRWKWVVVWAIALGSVVITFLPADFLEALANESLVTHPGRAKLDGAILLSLMTYGAMLLISGGITFWLYLRHTQAPAQESQ